MNPFFLGEGGDAGADGDGGGGGMIDAGGPAIDAAVPDADMSDVDAGCVQTAVNETGDAVSCDGEDNDCDGMIDEDTNLQTDPANCGTCGVRCALIGATGTCTAGDCGDFVCTNGNIDINLDLNTMGSDGCEYSCLPTNGGVEICDFTDNDCDFDIDEGFGGDTDVNNCGGCGLQCNILNAVEECVAGQCGIAQCETGFHDIFNALNPPDIPGCEYACDETNGGVEICDFIDNDCDGSIDNGATGGNLGNACVPGAFAAFGETGECGGGTISCNPGGGEDCTGYTGPTAEICDNLDNDCDGDIDNGFDTQNNVNACGTGCEVCSFSGAKAECVAGVCGIDFCLEGFFDDITVPGADCLYPCTLTNGGLEICDGLDNDCDGLTDLLDVGTAGGNVPMADAPPGLCNNIGICANTPTVCSNSPCELDVITWRCDYPSTTEVDNCFQLPLEETLCDNLDGDCDGTDDEPFLQQAVDPKGSACDNRVPGVLDGPCVHSGVFECDLTDNLGTICVLDPDQTPFVATVSDEVDCDNFDEDCDGTVDENTPGAMVGIDVPPGDSVIDYFIDAYEASRPDALAGGGAGIVETQACSKADVLPWGNPTWQEANDACVAAGKRLCTEAEWQTACEGNTPGTVYPYGNTYIADACNGNDFDPDCGQVTVADEDEAQVTGFPYGGGFGTCPSPLASCEQADWDILAGNATGTFDMSGNLKEWTSETVGASARQIRGGTYDSAAQGMTCQFDFVSAAETFHFPNLGFRCCADVTP